ncbi:MAG: ornithine cyclodeaminase family protein [Bacteroidota bacterium]
MSINNTLILTGEDVQQIIRHHGVDQIMDRTITELERFLLAHDEMDLVTPARSGFHYYEPHMGLVEWMPIYQGSKQVTLKIVGYHPNNPKLYKLPTILSTTSSYDSTTGHLQCLMDATLTTAIRTGAASALASKFLAKPTSEVLGIIGCGAQAVTQLHALSRLFPLTRVLYCDTEPSAEQSFEERCEPLEIDINFEQSSLAHIVGDSDILCTATSIEPGEGPLFSDIKTRTHLHINAVGADFPGKIEIPLALLKEAMVCPDFREQALVEGECQQLEANEIGQDLKEIITNNIQDFQNQRTVFDSTGWALEDQVMLDIFQRLAHQLSIGRWLSIESVSQNEKNPYDFLKEVDKVLQENG